MTSIRTAHGNHNNAKDMKAITSLLTLTILILFGGSVLAQETALNAGQRIGVKISGVPIEDQRDFDVPFTISDGGTIALPMLKSEIKAVGYKPSQLARMIESAYRAAGIYTNPRITVDQNIAGGGVATERFVTVTGEVRTPTRVPFVVGTRLLDVIAAAGGFTDFADTAAVKLIRDGKASTYDMKSVGSNPAANVEMQPNDSVIIREKKIRFPGFGGGDN